MPFRWSQSLEPFREEDVLPFGSIEVRFHCGSGFLAWWSRFGVDAKIATARTSPEEKMIDAVRYVCRFGVGWLLFEVKSVARICHDWRRWCVDLGQCPHRIVCQAGKFPTKTAPGRGHPTLNKPREWHVVRGFNNTGLGYDWKGLRKVPATLNIGCISVHVRDATLQECVFPGLVVDVEC